MIQPIVLAASVVTTLATIGGPPAPSPVPVGPVTAGTTAPLAAVAMDVQIWPEYDDPGVLAIYEGRLRPSVSTPVDFTFLVPAGARIHMVGGIDQQGRHVHAEYATRERDDGLVEITYRLEVPTFYMEFYYDPFSGRNRRKFTYPVVSAFPVDSLVVAVQKPRRAEGFSVKPSTGEVARDRNGFEYRVLRLGARAGGEKTPVTVTYRKEDREPSVSPDQAGKSASAAAAAGSQKPPEHQLAFFVLGIVAVLSGGAGLFYPTLREWLGTGSGRGSGGGSGRRRARKASFRGASRPGKFCSACGEALIEGANFCGACGQPTRRPR